MDKGRTKGSFKQLGSFKRFFRGIKKAAGALPGGNETATGGKVEKTGGGTHKGVGGIKNAEIEIWVNEGGAGGEGNR